MDIGTSVGSVDITDGTFTVVTDGADISGVSDSFHFVYQTLWGDGQVIARVADIKSGSNAWCKTGVMIRESLTPESRYAITAIQGEKNSGAVFQWRPHTGEASYSASFSTDVVSPPYWVKIVRKGDGFSSYLSPDGITWTQQDASRIIQMGTNVYAGLCAASGAPGELQTFTFDHVEYQGMGFGEETVLFEDAFPWPAIEGTNWSIVEGATLAYTGENYSHPDAFILMNGHPFGGDMIESMAIDLSSFSGAILSYEYKRCQADWDDDLIIFFWDGSTWIEVNRQTGRQTEMDAYQPITLHLPIEALHSDFRFQIRSIGCASDSELHDDWHIDNVKIMGWTDSTLILEETWPKIHEDPLKWRSHGTEIDSLGENEPSPPYSLHLNMGDVIDSYRIDLSSYSHAVLTYYFERAGTMELPEEGDDLVCMYWKGPSYRELYRHPGGTSAMTHYEKITVILPPEAMHENFKLHFECAGDILFCHPKEEEKEEEEEYDDWFIDDIELRVWR